MPSLLDASPGRRSDLFKDPPRRERLRRWDLLAFGVVLAFPWVGIAIAAYARFQVDGLERELVRDANAFADDLHRRPSQVDAPLPGSFADAVAPVLQTLAEAAKRVGHTDDARLQRVLTGTAPLGALPPAWVAVRRTAGPALGIALAATHAERAGPPADLDPFLADLTRPSSILAYRFVGRLAALNVWDLLDRQRADEAVSVCLDGLAFGRDLSIGTTLAGRALGEEVVDDVSFACAAAIGHAAAPTRARAALALLSIRDAMPSFEDGLHSEFVSLELETFGPSLDRWAYRALPPQARRAVDAAPNQAGAASWFMRLAARDGWDDVAEGYRALASFVPLDPKGRALATAELRARLRRRINPLGAVSLYDIEPLLARQRAASAFLTALAVGAAASGRAEHGAWPRRAAEALPPSERSPRENEDLQLTTEGEDLVVQVVYRVRGDKGDLMPQTRDFRFHSENSGSMRERVDGHGDGHDAEDDQAGHEVVRDGAQ